MAEHHSTPALAADLSPANSAGASERAFDFEHIGHRVDGLLHLAQWVERARGLTSEIKAAVHRDPALRARLQDKGIPYGDCWWEDEEQNGYLELLRLAVIDVRAMAEAGQTLTRQLRRPQPSH
jgi:hypothetical protein